MSKLGIMIIGWSKLKADNYWVDNYGNERDWDEIIIKEWGMTEQKLELEYMWDDLWNMKWWK